MNFEWLMPGPPKTPEEARAVRDRARRIPFLNGTLLSEDGAVLRGTFIAPQGVRVTSGVRETTIASAPNRRRGDPAACRHDC